MSARIIPTLKYTDGAAAIDWLCRAFGFEQHLVVAAQDGAIVHAQLTYAGSMIMLGSSGHSEFDRLQRPPREIGGIGTQSAYIIFDEADRHYQQSVAAGAEIVLDICDQDYGGRGYSCLDCEGHLWNFGTYDPWA